MTKHAYEKVVIVTRKTQLEELIYRFQTRGQAKFYLEHAGEDFATIEDAHKRYRTIVDGMRATIPHGLKSQILARESLPQFAFAERDLVVVVGQDGLVVNTAKYLNGQPILAINPDPDHIDGILLPFTPDKFDPALHAVLRGNAVVQQVSMAQARLQDGQVLYAVNDFFIGANSHVSARYRISIGGAAEEQSSSGVIVSTGVGSTGWMRSIITGAAGVVRGMGGDAVSSNRVKRVPWDANYLIYAVREPFPSKTTKTSLVFGRVTKDRPLVVASWMTDNGTIFSDGIESDYLRFTTGSIATIRPADRQLSLVVG
ncbi:MAG: sugar kinase [Nitrospirota bacterium]